MKVVSTSIRPGTPRTEGMAKALMQRMRTRVMAARMAGRRMGRMIRHQVAARDRPLTQDASSSDESKEAIAATMTRYATGRSSSPSTKIMPGRL